MKFSADHSFFHRAGSSVDEIVSFSFARASKYLRDYFKSLSLTMGPVAIKTFYFAQKSIIVLTLTIWQPTIAVSSPTFYIKTKVKEKHTMSVALANEFDISKSIIGCWEKSTDGSKTKFKPFFALCFSRTGIAKGFIMNGEGYARDVMISWSLKNKDHDLKLEDEICQISLTENKYILFKDCKMMGIWEKKCTIMNDEKNNCR